MNELFQPVMRSIEKSIKKLAAGVRVDGFGINDAKRLVGSMEEDLKRVEKAEKLMKTLEHEVRELERHEKALVKACIEA